MIKGVKLTLNLRANFQVEVSKPNFEHPQREVSPLMIVICHELIHIINTFKISEINNFKTDKERLDHLSHHQSKNRNFTNLEEERTITGNCWLVQFGSHANPTIPSENQIRKEYNQIFAKAPLDRISEGRVSSRGCLSRRSVYSDSKDNPLSEISDLAFEAFKQ